MIRTRVCVAVLLTGMLPGSALAASSPTVEALLDPVPLVEAAPAVDVGSAVQVARGQLTRTADGQIAIELSTGAVRPLQWPANVALPLGSTVVVSGTPNPAGPLLVDRVIAVK